MDDETNKVLQMAAVGAIGGAIRLCGDGSIKTWRMMAASLMTSTFAAGITAAFLHEVIKDPVYLGAICGMGGYMGQVMLVMLEKKTRGIIAEFMK